jgi:hypothetical protein
MTRNRGILTLGIISWAIALGGLGCSGSGGGGSLANTPEAEHIKKIPGFIMAYKTATKKQPTSLEEVRDWAVKEGKAKEEDFSSTRDKELYVISTGGMGMVVRERTGVKGKCYISQMGGISEVTADFAQQQTEQERGPRKGSKELR